MRIYEMPDYSDRRHACELEIQAQRADERRNARSAQLQDASWFASYVPIDGNGPYSAGRANLTHDEALTVLRIPWNA